MTHALVAGRPLVDSIEALYQLEPDLTTWARDVLAALERLLHMERGLGLLALAYSEDHTSFAEVCQVTTADWLTDLCRRWFARLSEGPVGPSSFRQAYFRSNPVTTWSQSLDQELVGEQMDEFREMKRDLSSVDCLGLFAYPEPGVVLLTWGLSERGIAVTTADRRVLMRILGHLDAAFRLQTRPDLAIAAVAMPHGSLTDIEDAAAKAMRARLRQRIVAIERARLRARRRDVDALDEWQALVEGRYTIVPREDRDGKRYYLLVHNAPHAEVHTRFSPREIDVLRLAARGFTNKATAYALGLCASSSSSALASAAQKVGLRSRRDLVAVARSLFGAAEPEPDLSRLTISEREVLTLLRRGLPNVAIARLRQRSVYTIANQVSAILAKLDVPSRRALDPRGGDEA